MASAADNGKESRARVLVVEDDETIRSLLVDVLGAEGYRVDPRESGEEALGALSSRKSDLVLLDLNLPGIDGLEVLASVPGLQPEAQVIVMTAFGSVDSAVDAMKLGAFDYIRKPFKTDELLMTIGRALEQSELRREVARLRRTSPGGAPPGIVGKSPPMRHVFDLIERVSPTRANVLITGETGTGKELVAQAIHELSDRARRRFVAVNCSALTESLLESELFGHMKGSFTGAIHNRTGLFEEASGGTLFLDEISTVSPAIQVKLLRVLQERKVTRVGGREPIPVDFRLVVATNVNLGEVVERGDFREDLFYRLNVFPIHVPPLRERRDDVPLLANYFRMRVAEDNGVEPPEFAPGTVARMMEHDWPGNVRELENYVERAVIMSLGGGPITFEPPRAGREASGTAGLVSDAEGETWDLDRLEREYILRVLERSRWHQGAAAEVLGINRRTLYRKLKRYREEGLIPQWRDV